MAMDARGHTWMKQERHRTVTYIIQAKLELRFVSCVLLYYRTSLNYELSLNSGALSLLSQDSYPREQNSLVRISTLS